MGTQSRSKLVVALAMIIAVAALFIYLSLKIKSGYDARAAQRIRGEAEREAARLAATAQAEREIPGLIGRIRPFLETSGDYGTFSYPIASVNIDYEPSSREAIITVVGVPRPLGDEERQVAEMLRIISLSSLDWNRVRIEWLTPASQVKEADKYGNVTLRTVQGFRYKGAWNRREIQKIQWETFNPRNIRAVGSFKWSFEQ